MRFHCKFVCGFRLLYEENLWNAMPELERTVTSDLEFAAGLLPTNAKNKLQANTKIYIHNPVKPAQEVETIISRYHPQYCKHHHFAGNIVISATRYEHCRLLWGAGAIIVHEFAHAFHDKCCAGGFENADIEMVTNAIHNSHCDNILQTLQFLTIIFQQAFSMAMTGGLYDCVPVHQYVIEPSVGRAYACTNSREFFAELSVAYLYANDTVSKYNRSFPFNRFQLQVHDPASLDILECTWRQFEF